MKIVLREDSNLPIYEQITQAVKQAILDRELAPGDMLPSIRSLARGLGISVITTKRAYEELEKQKLIFSQQGKGFYVKKPNLKILREEQLKKLEKDLAACITKGKENSLTLEEFKDMVDFLWKGRV